MLFGIAALILLFVVSNLIILISLKGLFNRPISTKNIQKKFSVIIALKNESQNIKGLMSSLDKLNYPPKNFEIILVDDNSTDNTYEFIKLNICDKLNYKLIKAINKLLPGKKGALDIGIKHANNPYIMITDADCQPGGDWLSSFALMFNEYDLLFGIAPFRQEKGLINNIACFENLRSSILTFSLANLGLPYSAAARSFGFKKEAFDSIGGYDKTTETLSGDDDLLLREAVKHKLKIGTVIDDNAFVFSSAKTNLKDYLSQKARHTTTSNYYLLQHKLFLAGWHGLNILFLLSPVLSFISPFFLIPFALKFIFDLFTIRNYQSRFGYSFNFFQFFYLQILYEVFLVINYIDASLGKKTTWK